MQPSIFCLHATPAHPDLPVAYDALAAAALPGEAAADTPDCRALLGPRQLLLESSPCTQCKQRIGRASAQSIVCDGCNAAFHLACVGLKHVPATYWYCTSCNR